MNAAFEQIQNDHRIYIGTEDQNRISYMVDELIHDQQQAKQLLDLQKRQLDAPNLSLTGLLFGKMYSVLTMGLFETIIKHGLIIDTAPSNIGIELKQKNAMNYMIREDAVYPVADLPEEQVKNLVHTFIVENLQPLFQTIAQVAKCKPTHMRSIVSHNLHQRKCALVNARPEIEEHIEQVFRWFTSNELFEKNRRNPLQFNFRYYTADNGKETYVRRHCCMKYMLHGGDKTKCCPTCPLIPDEERDERL
ncbi:hypothetical protein [Halobacillus sp. H74]|uniref:hypothetical protein n=1 Tax=Halobacillus sp. H74 TaxID=3457436 RepID=UPI003FCEE1CC